MNNAKTERILFTFIVLMFLFSLMIMADAHNTKQKLISENNKLISIRNDNSIGKIIGEYNYTAYYNDDITDVFYNTSNISFDDCFDEGGVTTEENSSFSTINWAYFNKSKCTLVPQ